MTQLSNSGRIVYVVAVAQGDVYYAPAGATTWTKATNTTGDTPPLNFDGLVYSAANNQKLWFADGVNYCVFNPSVGSVDRWSASAGTLPKDSQNNTPRLICTWRGRTVLSGLILDPQDWFMSKVGDPTDFNYAPSEISPTQAIAGINAPQGLVGDIVTSLCPYSDDVLVFFGDHTIYMMAGDPMAGGQIDLVSDAIGGAWGICWCKDPYGTIYFFSNKTGIYTLVPGQQPQRISQQIDQLLLEIDTGANGIRLIWDDRYQGLHVFVTILAEPTATTHFFYELRTGAWWQDQFGDTDFDPLTCTTFDGNSPSDRLALIGSWDGFIRAFSPTATDDDGVPISSSVVVGPLTTKDLDEILWKDLQAVLGETSGDVTFGVYLGTTAEKALTSVPVVTGTWTKGRNILNFVRRAAHGGYLKISSTNAWAIEQCRVRLATTGKVRRRGS